LHFAVAPAGMLDVAIEDIVVAWVAAADDDTEIPRITARQFVAIISCAISIDIAPLLTSSCK